MRHTKKDFTSFAIALRCQVFIIYYQLMANKRMFSLDIVDTDAFLEMPASTQALYFHLAMRADDDGFVGNPKKVQKICGAGEVDYQILCVKRFIIPFEAGICVIKHWKIHNYLRKDTYKETKYVEEKNSLVTKENGAYTEAVNVPSTSRDESVPQIREGKVREEENSIEVAPEGTKKSAYGEFKNVLLTSEEKQKLIDRYGFGAAKQIVDELSSYMKSKGKTYRDHYATLLNWAKRKGIVEQKKPAEPVPDLTITPEQAEKNARRAREVTASLAAKKTFKV